MPPRKTRTGILPYLNAQPLLEGLEQERAVKLVEGTPARLSAMLQNGKLDLALISSIECFRHSEFRILPEIGICSEGPIKSVKLYSRGDPADAQRVALDTSSRSAALLTKVVYLEFFEKLETEFVETKPTLEPESVDADAVLLIGDSALKAKPGDMQVTDLGALWTERTGLPFVYAVWTCREDSAGIDAILPLLSKARDRGLPIRSRLALNASKDLSLPSAGLNQYLTKNLRYDLGEREIKGLERFRDLASEHELCRRHDVPFYGARVHAV